MRLPLGHFHCSITAGDHLGDLPRLRLIKHCVVSIRSSCVGTSNREEGWLVSLRESNLFPFCQRRETSSILTPSPSQQLCISRILSVRRLCLLSSLCLHRQCSDCTVQLEGNCRHRYGEHRIQSDSWRLSPFDQAVQFLPDDRMGGGRQGQDSVGLI